MAQYSYRVVPFIGKVSVGVFSKDGPHTVGNQLQAVIDDNVKGGWEFYSVEKISIEVQPGCLGMLSGRSVSYMLYDQMIFRRNT
jgi:hypothetical protein